MNRRQLSRWLVPSESRNSAGGTPQAASHGLPYIRPESRQGCRRVRAKPLRLPVLTRRELAAVAVARGRGLHQRHVALEAHQVLAELRQALFSAVLRNGDHGPHRAPRLPRSTAARAGRPGRRCSRPTPAALSRARASRSPRHSGSAGRHPKAPAASRCRTGRKRSVRYHQPASSQDPRTSQDPTGIRSTPPRRTSITWRSSPRRIRLRPTSAMQAGAITLARAPVTRAAAKARA